MTVREHIAMQEKRAAEAAERAAEEARELKEYRSQLTFKASSVSRKSSPCLCHLTLILIGSLGLSKLDSVAVQARPMPQDISGPQRTYVLPEPKMTIPLSPQLQTCSRARLPA